MKKHFLKSWRGPAHYCGQQIQWKPADGSSLTESEREALMGGFVVSHPKSKQLTKLFVMDEEMAKWSIIIPNVSLDELKSKLQEVGYNIGFSWQTLQNHQNT